MIKTIGNTPTQDFWDMSGILDQKLTHTPIIVFQPVNNGTEVRIFNRATDLLTDKEISDDAKVMMQWRGQYKSDFYQMEVSDIRNKLKERS